MDSDRPQRIATSRAHRPHSTASLGLVLTFLVGLAGEAYGLHHEHSPGIDPPERPSSTWTEHGHASDPGEHHDPTEGDPCPCLGMCHGASASPLPSSRPELQTRVTLRAVETDAADERGPLCGPIPYLLPFANGPPTG